MLVFVNSQSTSSKSNSTNSAVSTGYGRPLKHLPAYASERWIRLEGRANVANSNGTRVRRLVSK